MIKAMPTPFFTRQRGMNVGQSAQGSAIPLVYGLSQGRCLLTWYNNWKSHGSPTNTLLWSIVSPGGKSKKSKKSGIKYYTAAIDTLAGHAPMRGVLSAWYNNIKLAVAICSTSGTISSGAFTFTPHSGRNKLTFNGTVPSVGPYQVTVSGWLVDLNTVKVNGVLLQNTTSVSPGAGQYYVNTAGQYTFNVAQAGQTLSIVYRGSTTPGAAALCAGIIGCTIAETFSASFNDFGAPGPVSLSGTWERPLWNQSFPIPGRADSGAYTARTPYLWNWNGVSTIGSSVTVTFPSALNGKTVTVYYGVPAIFNSNGDFVSSEVTPLTVLNMEWEQTYGSGSEYANYVDQQLVQAWCCGLGSPTFDLGPSNAMPNLNFEFIGAFTYWPNGDCDVCDIATDILYSGPVLP